MQYHQLPSEDLARRDRLMEAINLLCTLPGFDKDARATLRTGRFHFSTGVPVSPIRVEWNGPIPEIMSWVSMPIATAFKAVPEGSPRMVTYGIFRIEAATTDCNGRIRLSDGTLLSNVELVSAGLADNLTSLDWNLIHAMIEYCGAQRRCYYCVTDRAPNAFKITTPRIGDVDFTEFSKLEFEPLDAIVAYILRQFRKKTSITQIANTLNKCGARVRHVRGRRNLSTI
jgi:hypothetical protein